MPDQREFCIFVSPNGNDAWNGRAEIHVAGSTDGPFATIARARDAIRELKHKGLFKKPTRVVIRSGVYYLNDTIRFTPDDSGTGTCPIIYCAYPGETPVISGGKRLTGWQPDTVNGIPCCSTSIPEVAQGKWYFTQLFVNGIRRLRSRFPKVGFHRFAELPDGRHPFAVKTKSAIFEQGHFCNWKNLDDIETVVLQHWFDLHLKIGRVDEQKRLVQFKTPGLADFVDEHNLNARYYVENIFEEFTEPGQWYLDRTAGKLFYIPLPGENLNNVEVIAPHLEYLVQFMGTRSQRVNNIILEDIHFRHSDWQLPPETPGGIQSAFVVPGAIVMRNTEHCALRGCHVSQISQYAVELQSNCQHNKILSCDLHDLGAGGVKIQHETPLRTSPDVTGMDAFVGLDVEELGWIAPENPLPGPLDGTYAEIADCEIYDGGKIHHSAIGIWIGDSGYNYVHHNHIYNFYYSGISVGWTWTYAPTRTVRNRVEYNHIHDIGRGLLSDMGGIYFLGINPGSTIIGNVIHDVVSNGYGGHGLYTDQATSYVTIEDNIVYRTKCSSYHHHFGRDNIIRNNIFAFAEEPLITRTRADSSRSFIFENNILHCDNPDTFGGNWVNRNVILDRNLYWNSRGELSFVGISFAKWQEYGYDLHSIIADPRFNDPAAGDFSLSSNSPALALGFKPLDAGQAGPRANSRLFPCQTPCETQTPAPLIQSEIVATEFAHPGKKDYFEDLDTLLTATPGRPKSFTLMVRNYGQSPASGTIKIAVDPNTERLSGVDTIKYNVAPGRTSEFEFTALLPDAALRLFITTSSDDSSVIPNSLMLLSENVFKSQIVRTAADLALDKLKETLRNQQPLSVLWLSEPVARIQWIMQHDSLALLCDVRDRKIEQAARPWEGSCIELFAAMPESKTPNQLFLLPQTPQHPAQGFRQQDGTLPEPRIAIRSTLTPDGYELIAKIPFALLKLEPACGNFLMEISISAVLAAGSARIRVPLFGAANPSASTKNYGNIMVA